MILIERMSWIRTMNGMAPGGTTRSRSSAVELAGPMRLLEIQIRLHRLRDARAFGVRRLAHHSARHAEDEGIGRDLHSLRAHGPCPDDGTGAHHDVVEEDRSHADEGVVLDGGAMDDGAVADADAWADGARHAVVDVHHGAVLHVGVFTDDDGRGVTADHGRRPDAHSRTEGHVADDV